MTMWISMQTEYLVLEKMMLAVEIKFGKHNSGSPLDSTTGTQGETHGK